MIGVILICSELLFDFRSIKNMVHVMLISSNMFDLHSL